MVERAATRSEQRFALLKRPRRVWAVASVHGEAVLLHLLHRAMGKAWRPLDRIVYLGNMIGRGIAVRETVDELLAFRRLVLSVPHAIPEDIVYLRGSQEEMWQKLLQLQFATDPRAVLEWMLAHGVDATLKAYGGRPQEGLADVRSGPLALTRWTGNLRRAMQGCPGHYQLMAALRRAAFADDKSLLFVHAGLDPSRPLEAQADSFWWGHPGFEAMEQPYGDFARVVRGFHARHPGAEEAPFRTTVDGGCGFGGPLIAARFEEGTLAEVIEIPLEA